MQPAVKNHTDKKLKPELESLLGQVDSGKEPMTRRKNVDEFLEDIDRIISKE